MSDRDDPIRVIGWLAIAGLLFVTAMTCFWVWIGVQLFS